MFSANHTDRQLALERKAEDTTRERKYERKAAYERADDMVPRAGGREGKLDERRAVNDKRSMMSESMSAMRAKEDATMAMFKQMAQSRFGGQ
jgi:hypothetical protein